MNSIPSLDKLAGLSAAQVFAIIARVARAEAERIRQSQDALAKAFGQGWQDPATAVHHVLCATAAAMLLLHEQAKLSSPPKIIDRIASQLRDSLICEQTSHTADPAPERVADDPSEVNAQ